MEINFKISECNQKEKECLEKIRGNCVSNVKKVNAIMKKIYSLSNYKNDFDTKLTIVLKPSRIDRLEGWVESEKRIVLKCSGWKDLNEIVFLTIPHELFHLAIQRNKKLSLVIKKMANSNYQKLSKINIHNWKIHLVLEELLISSFIPEGYLSEKFSKIDVQKKNKKIIKSQKADPFLKERHKIAFKMFPLAKKYVENSKPIDEDYLINIINNIKK